MGAQSSPRGPVSSGKHEIVRPACFKHPEFGVFARAGRVFSRKSRWRGGAGRFISRQAALRRSWRRRGALRAGCDGGFALHDALLRRVVGVSDPRVVQFPPIGDGAAAVRGGMAPKSQTTSVKDVENGVLWARWSTFWAHQCLAVVRCSHVNPLLRAVTRYIAREPAT